MDESTRLFQSPSSPRKRSSPQINKLTALGILAGGFLCATFLPLFVGSFFATNIPKSQVKSPFHFILLSSGFIATCVSATVAFFASRKSLLSAGWKQHFLPGWKYYLSSGCLSGTAAVLILGAANPDRIPQASQALLALAFVLFSIGASLFVDSQAPFRWMGVLPIPALSLLIFGLTLAMADDWGELLIQGVEFWKTRAFWEFAFLMGVLLFTFSSAVKKSYLESTVFDIYPSALFLFWSNLASFLTLIVLFWFDFVPTIGYSDEPFNGLFGNIGTSVTCFFSDCGGAGLSGPMFWVGLVILQISNIFQNHWFYEVPLAMGFLLAALFWAIAQHVSFPFPIAVVSVWSFVSSFLVLLVGSILTYWMRYQTTQAEITPTPGKKRVVSPVDDVSFLNRLTYTWILDLLRIGWHRPLVQEDVCKSTKCDRVSANIDAVKRAWELERTKKEPNLMKTFFLTFVKQSIPGMCFQIIFLISDSLGPSVLMKQLLLYFEDQPAHPSYVGWVYTIALLASSAISVTARQYSFFQMVRFGIRLKAVFIQMVYDKVLVLADFEGKQGDVVTLAASDANRMKMFCNQMHYLWSSPTILALLSIYFITQWGWAGAVGMFTVLLLLPLQAMLGKLNSKIRSRSVVFTRDRVQLMSEIISGIKLVKILTWEQPFSQKLAAVRENEMFWLRNSAFLQNFNFVLSIVIPNIAASLTIILNVVAGTPLRSSDAFTILASFNILRLPISMLPAVIKAFSEATVAFTRLQAFLELPELQDKRIFQTNSPYALEVINASFGIKKKTKPDEHHKIPLDEHELDVTVPLLTDISVQIPHGQLVGIVGKIGCGKSSLLRAILGELVPKMGQVKISGTVAYSPQQAWLLNATLQDNITFGQPFDPKKYSWVIKICELEVDLNQLPHGDQTEIGEQGVNLSGGQKQRVSLARCLYSHQDIYLLDDPLSACDQHVGKKIFEECLLKALKGKTVFFVTNQLQHLTRCQHIIFLQNGKISGQGVYDELIETNPDFSQLMSEFMTSAGEEETEKGPVEKAETIVATGKDKPTGDSKFMSIEDRQTGQVDFSLWINYVTGSGKLMAIFFFVIFAVSGAGKIAQDAFVAYWIEQTSTNLTTISSQEVRSDAWYISVLMSISCAFGAIMIGRGFLFSWTMLRTATSIHNLVFENVLRSPMIFFDTTPLGRILNRFSQDQETIDVTLPDQLQLFFHFTITSISTMGVIIFSLPWFIIPSIPITLASFQLLRFYSTSSRELKRIESISGSPLFSHLSTTVFGLTTLRAYGVTSIFRKQNMKKVDQYHSNALIYDATMRWVGFWMDSLGAAIVFLTAAFAMAFRGSISPEVAGLAISFSFQMTTNFQRAVKLYGECENHMTSYRRLLFYAEELEQELPAITHPRPPKNWPALGEITFDSCCVRYRPDLPRALTNVSFHIKPTEKIGVVGRTGAGKSSLTLLFFRMLELEEGSIVIDGIDISDIGLYDLRSKLSIIPQEPVMFSGTLRYNLDPFSTQTEAYLWEVLEKVHLKKFVETLPHKMDSNISGVLSLGQKQLVCFARALLVRPKILLLDEATASIDVETDALIQQTIRECFKDCTVITIAHRLHTIADSDRVIVLDAGQLAEFDTPEALIAKPESLFAGLINDTDENTAKYLRDIIKNKSSSPK